MRLGDVLILERHGIFGSETSSRNSEVIHAGIYYEKNSLKAKLCVSGRGMLYSFCEAHKIAHRKCGKLIVAADAGQKAALDKIVLAARANGVTDLRLIGEDEMKALEPALQGAAAVMSPSTGIVDSHGFMLALLGDAEAHGAQIAYNSEVSRISRLASGGYLVTVSGPQACSFTTKRLVASAGLAASALLRGVSPPLAVQAPETRFARGNYFRLSGKAPFSRLVYPVPVPGGLGVHLTLDLGGQARFGPDVEWINDISYDVDPARAQSFYAAIRAYWPDLPDGALMPDYAGIRPKLSRPGEPAADFLIVDGSKAGAPGFAALLGMESPGLTASLAIADHVAALLTA
jgi:L-2-hydroxyglutarate oxidase LhgO